MSDFLYALIMGVVQGLTEFLPISSSGHLEIAHHLTGGVMKSLSAFDIILLAHLGTALSICYVYRLEIRNIFRSLLNFQMDENSRLSINILISTIPALIVGLLFEEQIEAMFAGSLLPVALALFFTGIVLGVTPSGQHNLRHIGLNYALLIGIAQMIAITPGVSRSGMTIAAALALGVVRIEAAKFSFLMVLPVIFGKVILDLIGGDINFLSSKWMIYAVAVVSSFLVGVWACKWMIRVVQKSQLKYFSIYCFLAGMFALVFHYYG